MADGYSWEATFKRSWDAVQEDESGSLLSTIESLQRQRLHRRRHLPNDKAVHRGIIRFVYMIIDLSENMLEKDVRPSRRECVEKLLESFLMEFIDNNPISQIGLIVTQNGRAHRISELSGNPIDHIKALKTHKYTDCVGEPSLQNALELALTSLSHAPSHGVREVIMVIGSLSTCDPGNIFATINKLKAVGNGGSGTGIRCSMVHLAAEVAVFRKICTETKGEFKVALNEGHLKDLINEWIPPPSITEQRSQASFVVMGFPVRMNISKLTLCACHNRPTRGGYKCPRCSAKICDLPLDCVVCGLTLVSSPHLARSYHHLFPVANFVPVETPLVNDITSETSTKPTKCAGCLDDLTIPEIAPPLQRHGADNPQLTEEDMTSFQCPRCKAVFCGECDVFVHQSLHVCPSCGF
ncbi:Ssl1-domain-containing protein [Ramicandelaber brevisporus]|nr:Ssl1-domain-containing protein [Ramicandelaber brevisporus]